MTYPQQPGFQGAPQYAPQPQYPQPQVQYAPLQAVPQYMPPVPQPQYAPQPQPAYAPQVPPNAQPAAPAAPLARGSLADAYAQGARTGGHGPSAKFPMINGGLTGVIARDLLDTDVQQETDYATKQPKFNKDGSPRWQMIIPVNVQPSAEFPEGKATVWAKGRMLSAVTRAIVGAGYDFTKGESLKAGDVITIVRIPDVPTNFGNPARDFDVQVQRGNGTYAAPAPEAPMAQVYQFPTAPVPPSATAPAFAPSAPAPQQFAPPVDMAQYQAQQAAAYQAATSQPMPPQPGVFEQPAFQGGQPDWATYQAATGQLPPMQAAPAAPSAVPLPGPGAPGMIPAPAAPSPQGLDPKQAALVKQLTGQPLTAEEAALLAA